MISSTVIKLSAPVARSSLIAIAVGLLAISLAIICYAYQYPYLLDSDDDQDLFYVSSSKVITITFSIISAIGILISLSTFYAFYKSQSAYTLAHAGLIGILVPAIIAAFFLSEGSRYRNDDLMDNHTFITNYKVNNKISEFYEEPHDPHKDLKQSINKNIDLVQQSLKCCGVASPQDWADKYEGFIPISCCEEKDHLTTDFSDKEKWFKFWALDQNEKINYCPESHMTGCRHAVITFEEEKHNRLGILIGLLGVICIADAVLSLLVYALVHTEHELCEPVEHEMSVLGVNTADSPIMTNMKPRPSISSGSGFNDTIAARALAVRFNLSNSPRQSISGPSKFSAAARRQSSFI